MSKKIDNEILKSVFKSESSPDEDSWSSGLSLWQDRPGLGGEQRVAPARHAPRNRALPAAGERIGRNEIHAEENHHQQERNATSAAQRDEYAWFSDPSDEQTGMGAEQRHWLRESQLDGSDNQDTPQEMSGESGCKVSDAELLRTMEQQTLHDSPVQAEGIDLEEFVHTESEEQQRVFARNNYLQQLAELTDEGGNGAEAWWNGHPSDEDRDTIRIILCEGLGNTISSEGHIAVMCGSTVYSFQGDGSGFTKYESLFHYLVEQDKNWHRDIKIFTIDTTPEEAEAMENFWNHYDFHYGQGGTCVTPVELSMAVLGLESGNFTRDRMIIRMPKAFIAELLKTNLVNDIITIIAPLRIADDVGLGTWDWHE